MPNGLGGIGNARPLVSMGYYPFHASKRLAETAYTCLFPLRASLGDWLATAVTVKTKHIYIYAILTLGVFYDKIYP